MRFNLRPVSPFAERTRSLACLADSRNHVRHCGDGGERRIHQITKSAHSTTGPRARLSGAILPILILVRRELVVLGIHAPEVFFERNGRPRTPNKCMVHVREARR